MTVRRSERSVNDVLYDIATSYPGGIEQLATRLGTTPSKLRNRLSPAVKDMEPTLKDFSLTMDYAQDANMENALDPIHALCWRHRGVFISLDELGMDSDECISRASMA